MNKGVGAWERKALSPTAMKAYARKVKESTVIPCQPLRFSPR